LTNDPEDEVFITQYHGDNDKFISLNLSKSCYTILRKGGFPIMTYSIDRSFGEIVSVSNHGQMLVFMSKVPDHLADFSLRRMTEDGL
jgi:hypothetical protein